MKTLSRRQFVSLAALATGALSLKAMPPIVSGPPQALPFVTVAGSFRFSEAGLSMTPSNLLTPLLKQAILYSSYPMQFGTQEQFNPSDEAIPANYQQAFDNVIAQLTPPGFTTYTENHPQLILIELIVGGVVLVAGSYAIYHIWKWADEKLKPLPPSTNEETVVQAPRSVRYHVGAKRPQLLIPRNER